MSKESLISREAVWPSLPLEQWRDTYATLHMLTQIVGKIRLSQTPLVNHYWNSVLYVTARGLTTSPIPHGSRIFQIDFDFIDHNLLLDVSDGTRKAMALQSRPVADFYKELMTTLQSLGLEVSIHAKPDEVPDPIPFAEDTIHSSYDPTYAERFWRILFQVDRVFKEFRSHFIGKCSPVHFFWGSFDLAVTRFSGRRAPERPGADPITREAYSHEVISHGFWPGSGTMAGPVFYSYTAPGPAGLESASIRPPAAAYSKELSEFLMPYDDVRSTESPDRLILEFCQSTYEAGATLANWDRASLER
ncbi:MAG TPA: DUF5996 family protein, partial [Blastocatellia bacterium]|nr:DUF5996 family protein [Blastocatellia bacterium]